MNSNFLSDHWLSADEPWFTCRKGLKDFREHSPTEGYFFQVVHQLRANDHQNCDFSVG